MTWKRFFPERLFNISKLSPPQSLTNCRISLLAMLVGDVQPRDSEAVGWGELMEKLRGMVVAKDRTRLDGLTSHLAARSTENRSADVVGLTVEDVRKLLRVAQLEVVKSKLREIRKNCYRFLLHVIGPFL
ncbi:hypothetical protein SLA2020_467290 [Shorea laevis]